MGFSSPPPKRRNFNTNNNSVAAVDLHNHPYPSPDQLYHQEISKTRWKRPTSWYSAFSTNDVRRVTMTQSKLTCSSLPLPPKTYPVVSPSLVQEESALKCWKWIVSDQDRGNCVFLIPTANCPHQWQHQRNDFHSRSGNAQGYMAAHPPSKNSVTGAFYDRVSGENQQIHNNDNYFRCRRKW